MSSFLCEYCDKSFTTKPNLKNHIKTAKYCLDIQGAKLVSSILCEFCDREFMQKITYHRHLEVCEERKAKSHKKEIKTQESEIATLTQELKLKNITITSLKLKVKTLEKSIVKQTSANLKLTVTNKEMSTNLANLETVLKEKESELLKVKEDLNAEVAKLKEELAFEKGKIEGYQTTKPPTINNQYIHPKLKDVPILNILPLDDSVEAYLYKYNYDTFLRGTKGAVEMLLEIVIFEDENGIINRNCVCTNRARNSFHILVNDKKWTKDNGASCIHSYLNMLKPLVNTHYAAFNVIMDDLITNGDALDMQLIRKRHAKLTPFRNGILGKPGMEAREKLLIDVRAGIRDQTSI